MILLWFMPLRDSLPYLYRVFFWGGGEGGGAQGYKEEKPNRTRYGFSYTTVQSYKTKTVDYILKHKEYNV